eukprot:10636477-Lingulodinium_polyedra.AAC.1
MLWAALVSRLREPTLLLWLGRHGRPPHESAQGPPCHLRCPQQRGTLRYNARGGQFWPRLATADHFGAR